MEWMLQVVDEIDDAIGAARQWSLGLIVEIGLGIAGLAAIAGIFAAVWMGEEPALVFAAAGMLSVAAALKMHGSKLQTSR
jgi:hypothetical protein